MKMIDKITLLMKEKGDTKASLARNAGIAYTTVDGMMRRGTDKTKYPTLMKLCDYFNCSIDYLVRDEIDDRFYGMEKKEVEKLNQDEFELIKIFRALPEDERKGLLSFARYQGGIK